jgi:hypothetical protein
VCLAIPALIQSINGTMAKADIGGIGRSVTLSLTPEAKVGDYVLIRNCPLKLAREFIRASACSIQPTSFPQISKT